MTTPFTGRKITAGHIKRFNRAIANSDLELAIDVAGDILGLSEEELDDYDIVELFEAVEGTITERMTSGKGEFQDNPLKGHASSSPRKGTSRSKK